MGSEGTKQVTAATPVHAVHPKVKLVAYTHQPYRIAVSSARTCYAKDFVFLGQLLPTGERARKNLAEALPDHGKQLDQIGDFATSDEKRAELVDVLGQLLDDEGAKEALHLFAAKATETQVVDDRIAESIYEAGHHTPFQHPHFVFSLEGVSRNVVESFFHQHTFFNSEQQSQRYVEMGAATVHVPEFVVGDDKARGIYDDAIGKAWDGYHQLREMLVDANLRTMTAIGKIKGQSEKQILGEAQKKAQEMARYVIPIAAATQMYHTVSGIVLLRYIRMANAQNAHHEARAVVDQMVAAVSEVDPDFVGKLEVTPHAAHDLPEWQLAGKPKQRPPMQGDTSVLQQFTPNAPAVVAEAIRDVTGSTEDDAGLWARVLNPSTNRLWNDTLNTWDHSPVLRAFRHVHLTFRKRQSLSAVAQDQRHRLTPGTRPMLQQLMTPEPDVYVPDVVDATQGARAVYDAAIGALWEGMQQLVEHGVPAEDAAYLLPNATNQYYTQSGDLLSYIHKWRLRLCFNAQKEIFDASLDELRQVQAVMPELTQWLGPPCTFVAAAQPENMQDDVAACCPEGPRWCGVKVWKNFDAGTGKPKRPY